MDLSSLTPQKDTVVTKLTNPQIVTKIDEEGNQYEEPSGETLTHNKKEMWIERYLPHTDEYNRRNISAHRSISRLHRKPRTLM